MTPKHSILTAFAFSLFCLLYSCANQISPVGGPKDETPPELIYSVPEDKTLNFKGNTVEMYFDEPIQVTSLKNELIITPTYVGEFDGKVRKYGVIVEFEEPFKDSTTYTLNFREAIKDITESNPAENLRIAFSTWDFLDSLSIEGKISELLTEVPVQEYLVGIYAENDTLTPFNGPPLYFSKTDSTGAYSLNNIRSGDYLIYAYNDKNNNLTIESKSEMYGFLANPIVLDSSKDNVDIQVTNLDLTELAVTSDRQDGQYYEIKVSKYITEYDIRTPSSDSLLYSKISDDHKSIILYNTFEIKDSLELRLTMQDSLYTRSLDTLFMSYVESTRQKNEFKHNLKRAEIHKDNASFSAEIDFTKPIELINFDSLLIEWDSLRTTLFDTSHIRYENDRMRIRISKEIEQSNLDSMTKNNETPKLFSKPGAFVSIENDTSLNKSLAVKIVQTKDFGIIRGSIDLDDSISYFIQLLDEKNQIVRSLYNSKEYSFEDVIPGTYRLRLLIDENKDGIWHPGNLLENQEPEAVFFYYSTEGSRDLILRANWELIDIDVDSLTKSVDKEEEDVEE